MVCVEFQFLIGTLKTMKGGLTVIEIGLFQFLIGTLKTLERGKEEWQVLEVSIPDRYAKNPFKTLYIGIYETSFNS